MNRCGDCKHFQSLYLKREDFPRRLKNGLMCCTGYVEKEGIVLQVDEGDEACENFEGKK